METQGGGDRMPGNEDLRRELDTASAFRVMADYRAWLQLLEAQYGHTITILQDGIGEIARFNLIVLPTRSVFGASRSIANWSTNGSPPP
jgi:hypothetical protein